MAGAQERTNKPLRTSERQAESELQRRHEELRAGTYRPQPARRVWIPKPGCTEQRPLGTPAVRDRIVHTLRNPGWIWEEIVIGVNRSLRGWHEHDQHSVSNVFAPLDGFGRRRLRSLLAKRRGRTVHGKGTAHQRWPNEWLARHGLQSLKELHDWKRTIVALRTH